MSKDISSLTHNELSRWIAEHDEPLSALESTWEETPENCGGYDPHGNVIYFSPRRRWSYTERDFLEWHARPYTDPEICLRLLKMIIDHDKDVIPDDRIIQSYFDICDERAIAEAYALANGYRPEGGQ